MSLSEILEGFYEVQDMAVPMYIVASAESVSSRITMRSFSDVESGDDIRGSTSTSSDPTSNARERTPSEASPCSGCGGAAAAAVICPRSARRHSKFRKFRNAIMEHDCDQAFMEALPEDDYGTNRQLPQDDECEINKLPFPIDCQRISQRNKNEPPRQPQRDGSVSKDKERVGACCNQPRVCCNQPPRRPQRCSSSKSLERIFPQGLPVAPPRMPPRRSLVSIDKMIRPPERCRSIGSARSIRTPNRPGLQRCISIGSAKSIRT